MEDIEQLGSERSPRGAQKRLGRVLQKLRKDVGLTAQEAAERIERSQSTITRLEGAQRKPNLDDVMDLLDLYEAEEEVREECIALARRARKSPWYQSPAAMSARQRTYAELEADFTLIRQYSPAYLPGMLHDLPYATERAEKGPAYGNFDPKTAVDGRLARQQVITRDERPVRYVVLLDEAMLRRRTAPLHILAGTLRHVLQVAARDNVEVRVIPQTAPPAMNAFILYSSDEPEEPTMVLIETATADIGPTDEDEVAHYERLFDWLMAAAYGPREGLDVIAAIADEFEEEGMTR